MMKEPRILVGGDALMKQLPALLSKEGSKHLLLAAGAHFLRSEAGQAFISVLGNDLKLVKETPARLLQRAILREEAAALPEGIDAVIAVGGGKSIDYAKALLYYSKQKPRVFVAVPTTAGSGSDATAFAVVYDGKEKLSLAHPALLPNVVVWQESLLDGLPQRQRAVSGLDALVQCLESLWSQRATPASRALAWEAGNWLWRHLPEWVESPGNELTLGAVYAAHYSGRAINGSRTTGPHALSYFLTAEYGVDHGHAVALLLPVFLRYNSGAGYAGFDSVLEVIGESDADAAADRWQAYVTAFGLPARLSDLDIPASMLDEWLENVNAERFANNPAPFDPLRLKALLQTTLF